ncbi:hypothetical protein ACIBCT_24795 [Streptosporangium sp. NPDC050855]|uniref:hypothetical protein n=1 Tax=Streptosporangium sp. NPDC050855 TaxID=3366194 RepID=UPI0037916A2D
MEVTLLNTDARPAVIWPGRCGPLLLDGRIYLDLTAAGTIAAAYDRYLHGTAIQGGALQISQDDPW